MTMFENENPIMPMADDGGGGTTIIPSVGVRPHNLNYNSSAYDFDNFAEGQCTWHCYGRAREVMNKTLTFTSTGNNHAANWWNKVTNCTKSQTPRANSIAVWDDGGYGHVAYVEAVSGNKIYFTEANWGTDNDKNELDPDDGVVDVLTVSAFKSRNGGTHILSGYLYL